jgi:hypothetical protein
MTRSRTQEQVWERERTHIVAETRSRLRHVAGCLPIGPAARRAVVEAAMEAARFHAMECTYANYELRTGSPYPPERRELEEEHERADWEACLARLEESLSS